MRFVDLMYSLPMLIVTIILVPMLSQDLLNIVVLWGVLSIPYNIRFMRSLVLQVKQLDYVRAAKVGGALKFKVMFKHIVPNSLSPVVITFFGGAAGTLLGLAGLSFLGLGNTAVATWGVDVTWARERLLTAIWAAAWPGIFIGITSVGFMLIGDGMRDALDPRLHKMK